MDPDPTLDRNEEIDLYFRWVGIKFDLINHQFVDAGLYFVQDENNFINSLLQAGSGSNKNAPDPAGQKSTDPIGFGPSSLLSGVDPEITI